MRASFFLSLVTVGLLALSGCASEMKDNVDVRDPSWTPPGQGDIEIGPDPEAKAKPKPRARHLLQPNHREQGDLHVATSNSKSSSR